LEDTTIADVLKTFETYYAQKDYVSALETLQKSKSEVPSMLWHYNMGTVLAKLENWPEARFHFLLAEKMGVSHKDLSLNKKIVESKLEINRIEKPISVTDYAVKGAQIASQGWLTSLSLVCLIVGLIKLKRGASLKGLALFLFLVLAPLMLNFWIKSWPISVITKALVIREGPSVIFPEKGELPVGVLVMTKEAGDWCEIYYPSRFQGWIKKNDLKVLE